MVTRFAILILPELSIFTDLMIMNRRLWITPTRQHIPDIFLVFLFIIVGVTISYSEASILGGNVLLKEPYGDTWFDSDVSAYVVEIDSRRSELHSRTFKHPLFSLILCLPVYGLRH